MVKYGQEVRQEKVLAVVHYGATSKSRGRLRTETESYVWRVVVSI